MEAEALGKYLDALLGYEINDWDRDELAAKISLLPVGVQREVLRQIPVVWPVSYALYYAFVDKVGAASDCLEPEQIDPWVRAVLDVYESKGLRQAQIYMDEVESNFLCHLRGENGLQFNDVENLLLPYLRGMAKREILLRPSERAYTDTNTIFLPKEINYASDKVKSLLIYKFTASVQLSFDLIGTFNLREIDAGLVDSLGQKYGRAGGEEGSPLACFFALFADSRLAKDLFFLIESFRSLSFMAENYAGLIGDMQEVLADWVAVPSGQEDLSVKDRFVESLQTLLLEFAIGGAKEVPLPKSELIGKFRKRINGLQKVEDSLLLTMAMFEAAERQAGDYGGVTLWPFMGELHEDAAFQGKELRRSEVRDKFVEGLALLLVENQQKKNKSKQAEAAELSGLGSQTEEGVLAVVEPGAAASEDLAEIADTLQEGFLTIGSENISMPEEMRELANDIFKDYGKIPGDYISSAVGRAGGLASNADVVMADNGGQLAGKIVYDEWDFRRSGYRKNWCHLLEKEVEPTKGTFVERTLEKYKGQLAILRRQFEMMSFQERFVRRQRDGDDIDLDAVFEAISDEKAGLSPSDRLFIRLQRDERNIAALFLVDMSSSTEGWISAALKEALILMCEALDKLGDRYAIYGFSGMRRSRCEFFRIKDFDQAYGPFVKDKIAGIAPREYTRMGPAIRHAIEKLKGVDSKVKLLLTLSDGKPEDYDDYKGAYAIEDTRHALIESKNAGIHPFCITIDQQAQEYIAHMYGEVNYIFIDDVFKLPHRIPDIYRNLTT